MMGKKNVSEGNSRNDMATNEDLLGMMPKYRGIKNFICNCSTPMTIAIQGDWGIGKTSAMKLIERELNSNCSEKFPCIWFNTWQFSVLNDGRELFKEFILYLLKTLNEMVDDSEDSEIKKIHDNFIKILHKGVDTLDKAAVFSENVSAVSNVIHGVCNFFKQKDDENKIYSETLWLKDICKNIEELIEAIVRNYHEKTNENVNFCIFIDDLDRLEPRIALELLEQLKNFMDFSSCVYVLAIDQKVVNQGLKKKYGEEFLKCENGETRSRADKFFDKLIQVPFPIPQNSYDLIGFMQSILSDDEKHKAKDYSQLLKDFNIYNPRSIKRYFNLCVLYRCIRKESENEGVFNDADFNYRCFAVNVLKFEKNDAFMRMAEIVLGNSEKENKKVWEELINALSDESDNAGDSESFPNAAYCRLVLDTLMDIGDIDERLGQLRSIINISGYNEEITDELKGVITLKKLLREGIGRIDSEEHGIELSGFAELLNGQSIKSIWENIRSGVTADGTDKGYLLKIGVSTKFPISRIYLSVFLSDRCTREEIEKYISKNTSFVLNDNMDMSDLSRSFYFVNPKNYLILYFGNNDSAVEDVLKLLGFAGYLYDDRKGEFE